MFVMRYLLFFLLVVIPLNAMAQSQNAYCDQASSTAAFQSCVKRHNAAAAEDLGKIYDELSVSLEGEALEKLQSLQQTWIAYRDEECAWESMRIEKEGLQKVYELSCQARMTEDRANLLRAVVGNEEESAQSELSGFPRWMNALTSDYPSVFWRFGERRRTDLNCDGTEEIIMVGAALSRVQVLEGNTDNLEEDEEGRTPHAMDVVVSVTGNTPTGKPQSQIFRLPVTETLDGPHLCDTKVSLKKYEVASAVLEEGAEPAEECLRRIQIQAKQCPPVTLSWTGKDYAVGFEAADDKESESKIGN